MHSGQVRLLGEWQALGQDGQKVAVTSKRERELLTALAVQQGERVSRDMLASRIWDRDDFQAKKSLNTTLWRLRSALSDSGIESDNWLETGADFMRMRKLRGPWVDAVAFGEVARTQVFTISSLDDIRNAIDLYQGDLAPGIDTEWLVEERRMLQERYQRLLSQALELLIEAELFDLAEDYAGRLIKADPFEERAWRTIISVQIEMGNRSQAVRTYQELEALLQAELGVAPSNETQALYHICREPSAASQNVKRPSAERLHKRVVVLQGQLQSVLSELSQIAEDIKRI